MNSSKIRRLSSKNEWIESLVNLGASDSIIRFIADILYKDVPGVKFEDSLIAIKALFEEECGYYFAKMLEEAFPGGVVCVSCPFKRVVYVYEGIGYDADGISYLDAELFLPIEEIGNLIGNFKGVAGQKVPVSKQEIDDLVERCKNARKFVAAKTMYDFSMKDVASCSVF